MVLYTVVCLVTSLVFLTFYLAARFSEAAQTENGSPFTSTLLAQRVTPNTLLSQTAIPEMTQASQLVETQTSHLSIATNTKSLLTEELFTIEPSPQPTLSSTPPPTATPLPTRTSSPTPDFLLTAVKATALAQIPTREMLPTATQPQKIPAAWDSVLQRLMDEKLIPSKNGSYYTLPDYEDSWTQTEWHRWTYLDKSPANFVIKAKASWDTTAVAGMTANSGCGFVFRENGTENYYLMYLGINGRVYLYRMKDGAMKYLGNSTYYPIQSPAGSADIMLVVNDIRFTFFINDDMVYDIMDGYFLNGKIGFTVVTGSAAGFGTRCKMENAVLWAIE